MGVGTFETSCAGLCGCPFPNVAAGNVATEDLVYGLERDGLYWDIQIGPLVDIAKDMAAWFGRDMTGRVHRTGPLE